MEHLHLASSFIIWLTTGKIISPTIITLATVCQLAGLSCMLVPDAKTTEYVPAWGGGNCEEPCNLTASMAPVTEGLTAACGPDIPFGTQVLSDAFGTRTCQDRGGAIENNEVDVAVAPDDYMKHGINGWHATLWVFPDKIPDDIKKECKVLRNCLLVLPDRKPNPLPCEQQPALIAGDLARMEACH